MNNFRLIIIAYVFFTSYLICDLLIYYRNPQSDSLQRSCSHTVMRSTTLCTAHCLRREMWMLQLVRRSSLFNRHKTVPVERYHFFCLFGRCRLWQTGRRPFTVRWWSLFPWTVQSCMYLASLVPCITFFWWFWMIWAHFITTKYLNLCI